MSMTPKMKEMQDRLFKNIPIVTKPSEPSQDELTDAELALGYLWQIDEAECSLDAWNLICNAVDALTTKQDK